MTYAPTPKPPLTSKSGSSGFAPDLGEAKGLLYGYALDQAADELDLAFGEQQAKVITGAEAAGINAYLEAAGRILKAAHSG